MASKSGNPTDGTNEDEPDLSDIPHASESNDARKRRARLNITFPVELDEKLKPAAEKLGLNRTRNKRNPPPAKT